MVDFLDTSLFTKASALSGQASVVSLMTKRDLKQLHKASEEYSQQLQHYFSQPIMQINGELELQNTDSENARDIQVRMMRKNIAKISSLVRWQIIQLADPAYWDLVTDLALINYCRMYVEVNKAENINTSNKKSIRDIEAIGSHINNFLNELKKSAKLSGYSLWKTPETNANDTNFVNQDYQPHWERWIEKLSMLPKDQQDKLESIRHNIHSLKTQYYDSDGNNLSPLLLVNIPSQNLHRFYDQSNKMISLLQSTQKRLRKFDNRNANILKVAFINISLFFRRIFNPKTVFTQENIEIWLSKSSNSISILNKQQQSMRKSMKQRLSSSNESSDFHCDDVALTLDSKLQENYARPFSTITVEEAANHDALNEIAVQDNLSTIHLEKTRGLHKSCRKSFEETLAKEEPDYNSLLTPSNEWIELTRTDKSLYKITHDQDLLFAINQLPIRFSNNFIDGKNILQIITESGEALWHQRTADLYDLATRTIEKHIKALNKKVLPSKAAKTLKVNLKERKEKLEEMMNEVNKTLVHQVSSALSKQIAAQLNSWCLGQASPNLNNESHSIKDLQNHIRRARLFFSKKADNNPSLADKQIFKIWFAQLMTLFLKTISDISSDNYLLINQLRQIASYAEHLSKTFFGHSNLNESYQQQYNAIMQAIDSVKSLLLGEPKCNAKDFKNMLCNIAGEDNQVTEQFIQESTKIIFVTACENNNVNDSVVDYAETYTPELLAQWFSKDAEHRSDLVKHLQTQLAAISENKKLLISQNDIRDINVIRTFANSTSEIHSKLDSDQKISPDIITAWKSEWTQIQDKAKFLLKNGLQSEQSTQAITYALPLFVSVLKNDSSAIDDFAYKRVEQLFLDKPAANTLMPEDLRLLDNSQSQIEITQLVQRSMKRLTAATKDINTVINPGLLTLISWAEDKCHLDMLLENTIKYLVENNLNKPQLALVVNSSRKLIPFSNNPANQN